MIRREIREGAWRWREVIAALALSAVGLWLGFASFGIVQWIGWGLAALGAALAISAAQKVRFQPDGEGAGVVTLDERRVTYLGPLDGGVADLDLMVQLDLTPSRAWRLPPSRSDRAPGVRAIPRESSRSADIRGPGRARPSGP